MTHRPNNSSGRSIRHAYAHASCFEVNYETLENGDVSVSYQMMTGHDIQAGRFHFGPEHVHIFREIRGYVFEIAETGEILPVYEYFVRRGKKLKVRWRQSLIEVIHQHAAVGST